MRERHRIGGRDASRRIRTLRAGAANTLLIALLSTTGVVSCATAPAASPSVLAQTVTAMDHGDWQRADELLESILPPPPAEGGSGAAGGEISVAANEG